SEAGRAGDIEINVGSLNVNNGGLISSSTSGAGQGGTITVNAKRGSVTISGQDVFGNRSSLLTVSEGTGSSGDIEIRAREVTVTRAGTIEAKSTSTGNAGNIFIQAQDTLSIRNGTVTTNAQSAQGGQIALAGHLVEIVNGSQ